MIERLLYLNLELWRPRGFSTPILMEGVQGAYQPQNLDWCNQGAFLPRNLDCGTGLEDLFFEDLFMEIFPLNICSRRFVL